MATTAVDLAPPQVRERPRRRPPRHHRSHAAWAMLAPNLLLLVIFLFGPLLWATSMTGVAMLVAFALTWRPQWLRPVARVLTVRSKLKAR